MPKVKYESAFRCSDIRKCLDQRNALQQLFVNSSRLHIPISFINEGLHGGAPTGTIFPENIGQVFLCELFERITSKRATRNDRQSYIM